MKNLLSFNRHRKRMGAGRLFLVAESGAEIRLLKKQIVEGSDPIYNQGASRDLKDHFGNLRQEFAGESELLYYHAQLIVLIRREYKTRRTFNTFAQLWQKETDYLLENLNLRWLVSAADTFIDHAEDDATRALGLCTSLLFNTVKLYESEHMFSDYSGLNAMDNERKLQLRERRTDLFDGTAAFVIGTDDTLRNLRWRLDRLEKATPASRILLEVFRRMQERDTVFRRFRNMHNNPRTVWW